MPYTNKTNTNMEIKFNDNPITIKTIEVEGKKLTKQIIQQFELKSLSYKHITDNHYRDINNLLDANDSESKQYEKSANIIGWINLKFEKANEIASFISTPYINTDSDVYTVLFIDHNNPEAIRRTYITKVYYNKLYSNTYPQLFI